MFSNGIFSLTCLGFILLPTTLYTFFVIFGVAAWESCGEYLLFLFRAILYILYVPAISIFFATKLLFGGEDKDDMLTAMRGLKLFEFLG